MPCQEGGFSQRLTRLEGKKPVELVVRVNDPIGAPNRTQRESEFDHVTPTRPAPLPAGCSRR